MVLEIAARFRFHGVNGPDSGKEPLDTPFQGRAYVFQTPTGSDSLNEIAGCYMHLHDVIGSEQFYQLRDSGILVTNAIMWQDGEHRLIDFFGLDFGGNNDWKSNPEIYSWVTRNGVLVPKNEICDVTCGKGFIIMGEEERHRLNTRNRGEYLVNPPFIRDLVYRVNDFANPKGKELFDSVLARN